MALKIAVVGAGYMGSQHARVIAASTDADVGVVVDVDLARAVSVADRWGGKPSDDVNAALDCDAAIVASATESHLDTALLYVKAGLPVLVEKPVATDIEDVELLIQSAGDLDVPFMSGFVERFNPVVTTAQELLLEVPTHIVALRHSPAAPRITNSVIHDLLIHDLDLAIRFTGGDEIVRSSGASWAPPGHPVSEIADCSLQFGGGTIATLSASRAGQRKLRSIQINTPSNLVDLDLLRQDVTVYRNVRQEQGDSLTYRAETIIDIPFVRHEGEPLALQLEHFIKLIGRQVDRAEERASVLASHRAADQVERSCAKPLNSWPAPTQQ